MMLKCQRIFLQHWSVSNRPRRRILEILSHLEKLPGKIIDKSMNSGVMSVSDFVGAYDVLYMKFAEMANDEG
jgi:hypothetical protein